jgi:UDP-N-acetylmuramoyl-tripeptide--D-alanyl-D-alanine ligase
VTLWSYTDLVIATGGRILGRPSVSIGGVSIDTRTLQQGDLFFAITGENSDGHAYVGDALSKGAAIAVVAEARTPNLPAAGPYLAVGDVLAALVGLGEASRQRSAARIVAVTGSVGKTTTKEALALALAASGPTHASVASYNNHWGVPLTLARMPATTAYGVYEIGMNHAGEITPLTGMVRPHVAIVTNVEPVHIEQFPSVEAIADAKAEIFLGLEPGGVAVVNRDNPHFERLRQAADARGVAVVGFGRHPDADARAIDMEVTADATLVAASIFGEPVTYRVGAPGAHVAHNTLAVLAATKLLGADLALGALALAGMTPPKGRGVRHRLAHPRGGAFLVIDEAYNANPASMAAAIRLAAKVAPGDGGKRIVVLGDMRELGALGPQAHAELLGVIEEAGVDRCYLCGPLMEHLWAVLPEGLKGAYAPTSLDLERSVLDTAHAGDVIMIKGSLGSRMQPIVEAFKARFARA